MAAVSAPVTPRRLATATGVAAPALTLGAILLATLLSPSFSWTGSALSDLGVTPGVAPVFNGGLVVGAVVGLPFTWHLWAAAVDPFHRAGATGVALALALMGGVGLFPSDTALHLPVAAGFFVAFTYAFFLHGTGSVRVGAHARGLLTVWLGVAHVTAWLLWGVAGPAVGVAGIALPEFAGALAFGGWVVWTALDALGWKP